MDTLKCPKCGKELAAGAKFCPECGTQIVNDTVKCPKCGKELAAGEKFCPECGAPAENGAVSVNKGKKSHTKIIIGILVAVVVAFAACCFLMVPRTVEVDARDLLIDYMKDPAAADQKYKGKTVKITHEILGAGVLPGAKPDLGYLILISEMGNPQTDERWRLFARAEKYKNDAFFMSDVKYAALGKSRATIEGTCMGKVIIEYGGYADKAVLVVIELDKIDYEK